MRGQWRWLLALTIGIGAVIWQRRKGRPEGVDITDPRVDDQRSRDIGTMSKADLYQEAKRLGIPGRSKMGRDELIKAMARVRR